MIIIQRQQRHLRRGRVLFLSGSALKQTIQGKESIHGGPITILEVERERGVERIQEKRVRERQKGVEDRVERERQRGAVEEEDKLIIKFVINLAIGKIKYLVNI